jgi:hypothetical protein
MNFCAFAFAFSDKLLFQIIYMEQPFFLIVCTVHRSYKFKIDMNESKYKEHDLSSYLNLAVPRARDK